MGENVITLEEGEEQFSLTNMHLSKGLKEMRQQDMYHLRKTFPSNAGLSLETEKEKHEHKNQLALSLELSINARHRVGINYLECILYLKYFISTLYLQAVAN